MKLAGIVPVGNAVTRGLGSWWRTSRGSCDAFLAEPDETWVGEVWVNPAMETEELLNGLLILAGAAMVDESEWMSCPNQLSLQDAEELAGLE
ncbi:hypothetical protein NG799_25800 [Laspinema sp. D1]|uniref:Uncharacterized protein n=1 Tax=Laspinema palackyanum D2a TaxID=2953684 RepID=A0ABT2MYA2_9CYAN|nr:hypothetical protein [Laspinema sp. D2a]